MSRKRTSTRTACHGLLSIDEAAKLLRTDPAIVAGAARCGQLPSLRRAGDLFIDGPALMAKFREPALQEANDAP